MTDTLTREHVLAHLLALCDAQPDRVNPTDGQACVYDDHESAADSHCIAGQFLVDHDLDLPSDNGYVQQFAFMWPTLGSRALEVLAEAQQIADGSPAVFDPTPWGQVGVELRKMFGEGS